MKLIQSLISKDKYNIKCPYTMNPIGICIHNTANDASAKNEVAYAKNNNNEVSYHIAVDDIEAIQWIPFDRNTWHAGDGGNGNGNRNYISIEICYSRSGGDRFIKAEKNCAILVAQMLKERGWGLDRVKKHQDFSGKYCPHRTLDLGWNRFINMIQEELNKLNGVTATKSNLYRVRKTWADAKSQIGAYSNLDNAKKACKQGYSVFDSNGNIVYSASQSQATQPSSQSKPQSVETIIKQYSENGVFTCTVDAINFRNKPYVGSDNPIQGQYYRGESVIYDYVVITNKYVWISWVSASTGVRRYMPIREVKNGVYQELWGYIK